MSGGGPMSVRSSMMSSTPTGPPVAVLSKPSRLSCVRAARVSSEAWTGIDDVSARGGTRR